MGELLPRVTPIGYSGAFLASAVHSTAARCTTRSDRRAFAIGWSVSTLVGTSLDDRPCRTTVMDARWPDGRLRRGFGPPGEESPGSTETRCRITSGGGDSRESATESKPPLCLGTGVRVKGCGKSAPRTRQRGRHGKPHREQGQIGAACKVHALRFAFSGTLPGLAARGARQRASQMNGHPANRHHAAFAD